MTVRVPVATLVVGLWLTTVLSATNASSQADERFDLSQLPAGTIVLEGEFTGGGLVAPPLRPADTHVIQEWRVEANEALLMFAPSQTASGFEVLGEAEVRFCYESRQEDPTAFATTTWVFHFISCYTTTIEFDGSWTGAQSDQISIRAIVTYPEHEVIEVEGYFEDGFGETTLPEVEASLDARWVSPDTISGQLTFPAESAGIWADDPTTMDAHVVAVVETRSEVDRSALGVLGLENLGIDLDKIGAICDTFDNSTSLFRTACGVAQEYGWARFDAPPAGGFDPVEAAEGLIALADILAETAADSSLREGESDTPHLVPSLANPGIRRTLAALADVVDEAAGDPDRAAEARRAVNAMSTFINFNLTLAQDASDRG
ncbi:MAG: hypothetical protein R2770_15580 [Acidimicrobiales bacterium]